MVGRSPAPPGGDDRRKLHSAAALQRLFARLPLASIIAGGRSPFIATPLFATFQSSLPIALYILGCGIIGIIDCAWAVGLPKRQRPITAINNLETSCMAPSLYRRCNCCLLIDHVKTFFACC